MCMIRDTKVIIEKRLVRSTSKESMGSLMNSLYRRFYIFSTVMLD